MNNKTNISIGVFAVVLIIGAFATFVYLPSLPNKQSVSKSQPAKSPEAGIVKQIDGVLDIKEIRSSGGIKAWLVEDRSVPVISITFAFKDVGTALDPANKQGLVQLVSNTMDEGAGELDSQAFQKELRNNSIRLSFSASRDSFGGRLETLAKNKDKAFKLLKLALTEPRFDKDPLERMKNANIARLRNSMSKPEWRALRLAYHRAFEGHPYAKNSGGTISGIQAVTPQDLETYVKKHLGKDRLFIGISGDIKAQEAQNIIDNIFGQLPDKSKASEIPDVNIQNQSLSTHHPMDIPQTHIQLWHPGISKTDKDYPAAKILNNILGKSGFGSRLMNAAREERGLTYGIYSYFQHFTRADALTITTSTKNEKAGEMMSIITGELEKLKNNGITNQELEKTKSYLTGSLPLNFTSNSAISGTLAQMQLNSLEIDYLDQFIDSIEQVKLAEVNTLLRRFPETEKFTKVYVGQPQGLELPPDIVIQDLPNAR